MGAFHIVLFEHMFLHLLELLNKASSKNFLYYIWVHVISTYWESVWYGGGERREGKERRKDKMRGRLQGIGTMCKIVDDLAMCLMQRRGK